jgi:demethylmacrocin O-methyltransferase
MTELGQLFDRYRSDKAFYHEWGEMTRGHGYDEHYTELFEPIRDDVKSLLEIGVWKGGSLRAWRDWFPYANIYGIDNQPKYIFEEPRIKTMFGDQNLPQSLLTAAAGRVFDIIIDDGAHNATAQITAFRTLWPKADRFYCIEDVSEPKEVTEVLKTEGVGWLRAFQSKGKSDWYCLVVKRKRDDTPIQGRDVGSGG